MWIRPPSERQALATLVKKGGPDDEEVNDFHVGRLDSGMRLAWPHSLNNSESTDRPRNQEQQDLTENDVVGRRSALLAAQERSVR